MRGKGRNRRGRKERRGKTRGGGGGRRESLEARALRRPSTSEALSRKFFEKRVPFLQTRQASAFDCNPCADHSTLSVCLASRVATKTQNAPERGEMKRTGDAPKNFSTQFFLLTPLFALSDFLSLPFLHHQAKPSTPRTALLSLFFLYSVAVDRHNLFLMQVL